MIRLANAMLWAGALLLAGCDGFQSKNVDPQPSRYEDVQTKGQTKQVPGPDAGAKTSERNVIDTPVTGEATGPRKCYELYRQAIKARDFDACWSLMSGPSKDAYEVAASELKLRVANNPSAPPPADVELLGVLGFTRSDADKLTGKLFMTGSMQRQELRNPEAFEEIVRTEFDHEAVFGNRAVVYLKIRNQRQPEGMNVVREGEFWRINLKPARPDR